MNLSKGLVVGALCLTVIALIIKAFALSVPHFVDVHLVSSTADQDDSNRIAGVGVFQSEFDATNPDLENELFQAGVPPIAVDSPSTGFPLLFPAQENFFPEILPANRRTLPDILPAFPADVATEVENIMFPVIDNVAAVEFESCETFVPEMLTVTSQYFFAFQDGLVPSTIGAVQSQFKTESENGLFPVLDALFSEVPNDFSFPTVLGENFPRIVQKRALSEGADATSCSSDFSELLPSRILSEGTIQCLIDVYDEYSRTTRLDFSLFDFGNAISRVFEENGQDCIDELKTPGECIQANAGSFFIRDTPLNEAAEFFSSEITPCNGPALLTIELCGGGTKREYILRVAGAFLEIADDLLTGGPEDVELGNLLGLAGLGGALGLYATNLTEGTLFVSPDATIKDRFNNWKLLEAEDVKINPDLPLSQSFEAACESLLAFSLFGELTGTLDLSNVDFDGKTCTTVVDYFPAVTDILVALGEDLAPTVGSVSDIYISCFGAQLSPDFPDIQVSSDCPGLFGFGLMQGLLGEDKTLLEECEDDAEDKEKIGVAQGFAISSTLFESVSLLLIIVALSSSIGTLVYLAPIASFLGSLAGILIISSLLVVQSAPVYESVGGEPAELEPTYFTGYVGILAFVDAFLLFISAVLLCCGTCKARKQMIYEAGAVSENKSMDEKEQQHTL